MKVAVVMGLSLIHIYRYQEKSNGIKSPKQKRLELSFILRF